MTKEQLLELQKSGYTCRSCWWQEGGLCYAEPCERKEDGRSTKEATELCEKHKSKRGVLSSFFGDMPITIVSEGNDKNNPKL